MNWMVRLLKTATFDGIAPTGVMPTNIPQSDSTPAVGSVGGSAPAVPPVAPMGGAAGIPQSSGQIPGVTAEVTQNQYGSSFLVLGGETFKLNKALNLGRTGMGFNWFGAKKTWSKKLDMLTADDIQKLTAAGVDLSVLQQPQYAQMVGGRAKAQTDPNAPQTPAEEKIQKFRDEIAKAVGDGGGSEKVKAITAHVEKTLEQLALSTDAAAQDGFVKAFLVFSSKFWQYSFANQMLIYIQKPTATYCRGPRQWEKMGRRVVNPQNGISILSPRFPKEKEEKQQAGWVSTDADGSNPESLSGGKDKSRRPMFFVPVEIFDISDTEAIPGWTDPETGAPPFEGKPPLKTNPNEESEHVNTLVHAAATFAADKGIKLDLDKDLPQDLGGYSKDEEVVVNKAYKGVNQFSTLIHELAHWYLHQFDNSSIQSSELQSLGQFLKEAGLGDRVYNDLAANIGTKFKTERTMVEYVARMYNQQVAMTVIRWYKQKREIEAESTAFIVLHHFGLDTKDAPNYLALWKANGEKVKSRRDGIVKACQAIIQGIEGEMHEVPQAPGQAGAPMTPTAAGLWNWYKLASYQTGDSQPYVMYRCNCYGCGRESVRVAAAEIMAKRADPAGWRCPSCRMGHKTSGLAFSAPVDRDRSFAAELQGRYTSIDKAKRRIGVTASSEVEAALDVESVTTDTNFSNYFNSSTGNGWGSLPQDDDDKKRSKKSRGAQGEEYGDDDDDDDDRGVKASGPFFPKGGGGGDRLGFYPVEIQSSNWYNRLSKFAQVFQLTSRRDGVTIRGVTPQIEALLRQVGITGFMGDRGHVWYAKTSFLAQSVANVRNAAAWEQLRGMGLDPTAVPGVGPIPKAQPNTGQPNQPGATPPPAQPAGAAAIPPTGGFAISPKGSVFVRNPPEDARAFLQGMGFTPWTQNPNMFYCDADLFKKNVARPQNAELVESLKTYGFDPAAMAVAMGGDPAQSPAQDAGKPADEAKAAPTSAYGAGNLVISPNGLAIMIDRKLKHNPGVQSALRAFGFYINTHSVSQEMVMGKNQLVEKFYPKTGKQVNPVDVQKSEALKSDFEIDPIAMADWLVETGKAKVTGPQKKGRAQVDQIRSGANPAAVPGANPADPAAQQQQQQAEDPTAPKLDPHNVNEGVKLWYLFQDKTNPERYAAVGKVDNADDPTADDWKVVEEGNGVLTPQTMPVSELRMMFQMAKLDGGTVQAATAQEVLAKAPKPQAKEQPKNDDQANMVAVSKAGQGVFVVSPSAGKYILRQVKPLNPGQKFERQADKLAAGLGGESVADANQMNAGYTWATSVRDGSKLGFDTQLQALEYAQAFLMEDSGHYREQRKKYVLDDSKLTPEGKAIDSRMQKMAAAVAGAAEPLHTMVRALAGTGKTTTLAHLAWKFGKAGQRWLYIVFNAANAAEAKEKFPAWVDVMTSHVFMGQIADKTANAGLPGTKRIPNARNAPTRTKILMDANTPRNGGKSPSFPQLFKQSIFPNARNLNPDSNQIGDMARKMGVDYNFVNAAKHLCNSIQRGVRGVIVHVADLAKAYAIDPLAGDSTAVQGQLVKQIVEQYSITQELEKSIARQMKSIGDMDGDQMNLLMHVCEQFTGIPDVLAWVDQKAYMPQAVNIAHLLMVDSLPGRSQVMYEPKPQKGQPAGKPIPIGNVRDYDDDLWMPAIRSPHVKWPKYDFIMADEVQDFNRCQALMLQNLQKAGGQVIAVGDPNQGCYRFRGADSESFNNIAKYLHETSSDKDVQQGLTLNWRCDENILDFTNQSTKCMQKLPPELQLKSGKALKNPSPDGKKAGIVSSGVYDEGDMIAHIAEDFEKAKAGGQPMKQIAILARTNAPVAEAAMALLAKGIPFKLAGKDFSKELIDCLDEIVHTDDLAQKKAQSRRWKEQKPTFDQIRIGQQGDQTGGLHSMIAAYMDREVKPLLSSQKVSVKAEAKDKQNAVNAVNSCLHQFESQHTQMGEDGRPVDQGHTVANFVDWLKKNLSETDPETEAGKAQVAADMETEKNNPVKSVMLSTAHKSKGLEYDSVYLIRPELFPHPNAELEPDKEQEDHLLYVTLTRAKGELHICKEAEEDGGTGLFREPADPASQNRPQRVRDAGIWTADTIAGANGQGAKSPNVTVDAHGNKVGPDANPGAPTPGQPVV